MTWKLVFGFVALSVGLRATIADSIEVESNATTNVSSGISIHLTDDPEVATVQATEAIPDIADGSASNTAPSQGGLSPNTTDTSTRFGWFNNSFTSGVRYILELTPLQGLNTAFIDGSTESASLLSESPMIRSEPRSSITVSPISRGRSDPETSARGSFWFPARSDLDTLLSKIDSQIVNRIVAVGGPYSARYGPGLAFYDVQILESPRFANGFEIHGNTNITYKTNGDQWHGRSSIWGGNDFWGFRLGYGHRAGDDYESGDGTIYPSGFNSRMWDLSLGADIDEDTRIEFLAMRLDQTDLEFPTNFDDINFLYTDAYEMKLVQSDQSRYDQLQFEVWYNRTVLQGDNFRPAKRELFPVFNIFEYLIETDVDATSTGYSLEFSWDDALSGELIVGSDLRYLQQRVTQFQSITPASVPIEGILEIPRAHSANPGLFFEHRFDLNECTSITSGGRVDLVANNADEIGEIGNLEDELLGEFDQHFELWSVFSILEKQVDQNWRLTAGAGHSMRPPSLQEMYADAPYFGVLPQQAFAAVFGNPHLDAESMWQIDVGILGDFDRLNVGLNGFHSWVSDYITLDKLLGSTSNLVPRTYSYVNTELATLAGFDFQCDFEITRMASVFSNMSYVEGRDHARNGNTSMMRHSPRFQGAGVGDFRSNFASQRHQALPAMAPFESTVGLNLQEPIASPRWSVTFSARIVDDHHRVAELLDEQPTPGYTLFDIRGYARLFSNVVATAGVENLTDELYQTVYDVRLPNNVFRPGRNYYFGLDVTY